MSTGGGTVDTNSNNDTIAGVISGSTGLTKIGAGTLTLSGTDPSYSGTTSVNAGTLEVDGSITNSAVTINNAAILSGSGTTGAVTFGASSTSQIVPSSPNLTVSSVTFGSGNAFNPMVGNAGSDNELIVSGAASLAGTLSVPSSIAVTTLPAPGSTITLIHAGTRSSTFTAAQGTVYTFTDGRGASITATLNYTSTTVELDVGTSQTITLPAGNYTLSTDGSGNLQLYNGTSTSTWAIGNLTTVTLDGTGASAAVNLSVDFIHSFGTITSINFTGPSGQNNDMAVKGDGSDAARYVPIGGNGTVTVTEGLNSVAVGFMNLKPMDISGMTSVTVTVPAASTSGITVLDGLDFGTGTHDAVVVRPGNFNPGPGDFEQVALWNDTSVTVDSTAVTGSDPVTVNSLDGSTGYAKITNFTINTPTTAGNTVTFAASSVVNVPGTFSVSARSISESTSGNITAGTLDLTALTSINTPSVASTTINASSTQASGSGGTVSITNATATVATVSLSSNTGAITFTQSTSDVMVLSANAGTAHTVSITSTVRAILDGGGSPDITASSLTLTAATAIGSSLTALTTSGSNAWREDGPAALEPVVRAFVASHPADAWGHRTLAVVLAVQRRTDEAYAELERAYARWRADRPLGGNIRV